MFEETEADENQKTISSLILFLKYRTSIENLFIDLKICEDFLPDNQWVLGHFQVILHMIAGVGLLLQGSIDIDKSPLTDGTTI